jgi:hypothetical protein
MLAPPVTLLCVLFIANQPTWTLGRLDLVLAALIMAAVAARAVDALRYGGTTASGDPADRSHVLGYAVGLVLVTALAWALAQSVAW